MNSIEEDTVQTTVAVEAVVSPKVERAMKQRRVAEINLEIVMLQNEKALLRAELADK